MVLFNQWGESFIFIAIYSVLIIVPCVIAGLMGKKVIYELGHWPTQTPTIQMKICFKLVVLEIITFGCLYGFAQAFKAFSD